MVDHITSSFELLFTRDAIRRTSAKGEFVSGGVLAPHQVWKDEDVY
jgi:hypothetical protein